MYLKLQRILPVFNFARASKTLMVWWASAGDVRGLSISEVWSFQIVTGAHSKYFSQYCCTVWGKTKNENLLRLSKVQKRCAKLILDASFSNNSVELFSKIGWLPIDDVIRKRKLCLMYKIVNGCCLQYFKDYISYVNDKHRHNTRASTNNNLLIPLFRTNSGLRTFYASVNRLWNTLDDRTRSITTLRNFKKYISIKYVVSNPKLDHFTIHRNF